MGKIVEQLCWDCINAVPDIEGIKGCSWSRDFILPEGVIAIPRTIKGVSTWRGKEYQHNVQSYKIISCPQFRSDRCGT